MVRGWFAGCPRLVCQRQKATVWDWIVPDSIRMLRAVKDFGILWESFGDDQGDSLAGFSSENRLIFFSKKKNCFLKKGVPCAA